MTARSIAEAFADAAARLIERDDAAGSLIALLTDCAGLLGADAAGLLVQLPDEGLELLSSTAHTANVLELYELQHGHGPCVEAVACNTVVSESSPDLARRWDPVGSAILAAGFQTVYAFPLPWHDRAVGALNLFTIAAMTLSGEQEQLGRAFANLAIAVVANPSPASWTTFENHISAILAQRATIEHAKGVLAVQHHIDLAHAFTILASTAAQRNLALLDHAHQVLASVHQQQTL